VTGDSPRRSSGRNRFRLIGRVFSAAGKVFIRTLMDHREYFWKPAHGTGTSPIADLDPQSIDDRDHSQPVAAAPSEVFLKGSR